MIQQDHLDAVYLIDRILEQPDSLLTRLAAPRGLLTLIREHHLQLSRQGAIEDISEDEVPF
jgi:hypothetical protein